MDVKQLVKNDWYFIDNGFGLMRAKLLESPKQGRGFKKAVLMDVRGSEIGMFDDMGSVYVTNIVRPEGNPIPHAAFS